MLFNPAGTKLIGTEVNSSLIDSFTVQPAGRLKAAPGSPFKAQGTGPFGSQFRPTSPDQLFVTNAHNGAVLAGHHRDGRRLFAVNTGSGFISFYSIPASGTLGLPGSTQVSASGGGGAVDPGVTPDGRYLYVNETRIGVVGAFAIGADGTLTELPGSPAALPTARPRPASP